MAPFSMASMTAAVAMAVMLFGSSCQTATAALFARRSALNATSKSLSTLGAIREAYTTNAICAKKNCINPVFPGMEDLHRLSQSKWICSSLQKTSSSMGFCKNAITYDPALPLPAGGGSTVKALVQRQDNAAATMFYYHLTGLGLEAWDYQKPEFADDCIKSIWRMVCFTYFPRAEIGCQDGAWTNYIRPCQSSCFNYVRSCGVECCDESVQCVFTHTKAINAKQTVTTEGYSPHDGPSSLCTGGAKRSAEPLGAIFWLVIFVAMALSLQGCDYDVPMHKVGNWRGEPDYLIKHEFVPPGGSAKTASLNSCSISRLSQTLQCSGRGVCKMWDPNNFENHLSFCDCDRDWTDPECRTRRKSQTVAYLLALFFGFLGADQFYLGFIFPGIVKLFTFGGFGILWVSDIIRIGSAPVYSTSYRTAADLPHYAFVLISTMAAVFVGFGGAYVLTVKFRSNKRRDAMMLQADEESRQQKKFQLFADAYTTGNKKPIIEKDGIENMDYGATGQMPGPPMGGPPMTGPPMGGPPMTGGMPPPTMPPMGAMPPMPTGGMPPPPMGPVGQSMREMPVPSNLGPMPGGTMNMGNLPPGMSMNMGPPPPPMGGSMTMGPPPMGSMPPPPMGQLPPGMSMNMGPPPPPMGSSMMMGPPPPPMGSMSPMGPPMGPPMGSMGGANPFGTSMNLNRP